MRKEISLRTTKRAQFVDVTAQARDYLREVGAKDGLLVVFVPHTTAGVTVNENADPDVVGDMTGFMSALVPPSEDFRHGEGNSDAHIKSSLFSPSLTLLVEDGELLLGTWQGLYFAEFDGPRSRKLWFKFAGE